MYTRSQTQTNKTAVHRTPFLEKTTGAGPEFKKSTKSKRPQEPAANQPMDVRKSN